MKSWDLAMNVATLPPRLVRLWDKTELLGALCGPLWTQLAGEQPQPQHNILKILFELLDPATPESCPCMDPTTRPMFV